ncbi:MAG: nitroreductase family protein [Candidatus Woesearchaeota archaeon]|nr:MAG: nitroreductase family protein [Candidatus Woesearchaeota archaeon]
MEILDIIKSRRTIRNFKDEDISDADLGKILEAGNSAPCAGKLSNWRFIVVKYQKDKERLAEACFNQEWVANASVLVVICSDGGRIKGIYGKRGEMYAIQNTAAAIENMLIEATALGIGSAWVGAFDPDGIVRVLEIPNYVEIHAVVALGYPNEKPRVAKLKLPDVVFFDKWGKPEKGRKKNRPVANWLILGGKP